MFSGIEANARLSWRRDGGIARLAAALDDLRKK
jgi:hypothetical protein